MHDEERLFHYSIDLLCIAGADGRFRKVNPAFGRVLGYSEQELTERPFLDYVHPDDRAMTIKTMDRLRHGQRVLRFENRYRCKDGSFKWLSWTCTPDPDGDLLYAVARDTTEIKQSLETLMRNLPGMVYRCLHDEDWTMTFVSEGSRKLTGYAPADLVGNRAATFAGLVHPEDRDRVWQEVDAAIRAKQSFHLEYRIRTASGKEKVVWEQGHAIDLANGDVFSLEGFISDVTERRELETELSRLQRMDSLGQLTGGIAHDFNNLLAVVIGNLELLEEWNGLAPDGTELVGEAMDAAWRGAELSQRLLAFSRQQMLAPELVAVNALIKGMESMLRRTLGAAIDIEIVLGENIPSVLVDSGQLENAILNLAINARDAMPDGGQLLIHTARFKADKQYAQMRPDVTPGRYVMIEIADSGVGMAPEIQERVFEPFFTTKEPGKGTGLGLSMVYGFLKQSGGHARLYSELGHGTSVKLYLPEAAIAKDTQTVETLKVLAESRGSAERIMVVEDDAAVRKMAVRSLQELGYQTLEAASAPAALAMLEKGAEIDLLFSDLVMPGGMSGLELATLARQRFPGLRVLLTSGFSEQQAARGSEYELLGKPYRKVQLAQAIRRALR